MQLFAASIIHKAEGDFGVLGRKGRGIAWPASPLFTHLCVQCVRIFVWRQLNEVLSEMYTLCAHSNALGNGRISPTVCIVVSEPRK